MALLSITDLFTPATADEYMAKMLSLGQSLKLKTTAWQSGGVTRTILAIASNIFAGADQIFSIFAQGGYLDWAAKVTPEGGPGWLDTLAHYGFNEDRAEASAAAGPLLITNASGSTYGPFAAGTYHVEDPTTHATFHNVASLTIAPSAVTAADFEADSPGSSSTAIIGGVTAPVTSLIGVTCSNAVAWVGTDADTNAQLVAKCKLKLATFAQRTGPMDAYVYFALNADKFLAAGVTLTGGKITRAKVAADRLTGTVTVTIANGGGAPIGGDVTKVDGVIQAQCVPDAVTATTQAATNKSIVAIIDAYFPAAYLSAVNAIFLQTVTNYFAAVHIGGTLEAASPGIFSYSGLIGAIESAMIGVGVPKEAMDIDMTLNGGTADIALASLEVPVIDAASVLTTHGV